MNLQKRSIATGGLSRSVACATKPSTRCRAVVQNSAKHSSGQDVQHSTVGSSGRDATSRASTSASDTFLADFGTRVALERLYHRSLLEHGDTSVPDLWASTGVFLVTVDEKPQRTRNQERTPDYFANVGDAIRTLREDIPDLFERDLNYVIYRDDVVFRDPRNKFDGIKNYKMIFWSLRFHGRIFFKKLYVEVKRIWQPEDTVIKMRWTVHGIPRVPWEAEGLFDGISTYKLDNSGRVYEHSVDNVLLRDPPMQTSPPLLAGLNLVPSPPQPSPGMWFVTEDSSSFASTSSSSQSQSLWQLYLSKFSWVRLYAALLATAATMETCHNCQQACESVHMGQAGGTAEPQLQL